MKKAERRLGKEAAIALAAHRGVEAWCSVKSAVVDTTMMVDGHEALLGRAVFTLDDGKRIESIGGLADMQGQITLPDAPAVDGCTRTFINVPHGVATLLEAWCYNPTKRAEGHVGPKDRDTAERRFGGAVAVVFDGDATLYATNGTASVRVRVRGVELPADDGVYWIPRRELVAKAAYDDLRAALLNDEGAAFRVSTDTQLVAWSVGAAAAWKPINDVVGSLVEIWKKTDSMADGMNRLSVAMADRLAKSLRHKPDIPIISRGVEFGPGRHATLVVTEDEFMVDGEGFLMDGNKFAVSILMMGYKTLEKQPSGEVER